MQPVRMLRPLLAQTLRTRALRPIAPLSRGLSCTKLVGQQESSQPGFFEALLHGSGEGKDDSAVNDARMNLTSSNIWDIQRVHVKPEKMADSKYHPMIEEHYKDVLKWAGSWEVVVGDIGYFYHFWRYQNYAGVDKFERETVTDALQREYREHVYPLSYSRQNWLTQAFSFWNPTLPPKNLDTIYELRTYHLKPGHLLEWERDWRKGLEARRPYQEPVGAWFSHVGELHTVFHIWEYPSLEEREKTRAAAWQVEAWSTTVNKTVRLIDSMHSQIMRPIAYRT
ncbi:hypothetical protein CBS9595_001529 [Malassezia furfur]|nr:hypothetical protein CBS9595_001529 [Malassezia furfur]